MSTADVAPAPVQPGGVQPGGVLAVRRGVVRAWLRLLRSELGLMFRRWRNRALLAVVVAIPILLGSALRVAVPEQGDQGGGGNGPAAAFLTQVAGNGVFLSFLALTIMLTLMLPLVVAVVSGESLAGEANTGTLRYLLVVPAGRARLLSVKYVAVALFALVACLLARSRCCPAPPCRCRKDCCACCSWFFSLRRPWPCSARSDWPSPASPSTRSRRSPPS